MTNSSSTAKDLTAGTVGGIAQVLVGQPFDIVKVVRVTPRRSPFPPRFDAFSFAFNATANFSTQKIIFYFIRPRR